MLNAPCRARRVRGVGGRWRRAATAGSIVIALAGGCAARQASADAGKVHVVVAFYPLEEAATKVGGDAVSVTDLTPPGVEPHDLELSPSDLEAISNADLLLYLGKGFQPAVEDAAPEVSGRAVDLLEGSGGALRPDPEGQLAADPHVWLDPVRYAALVRATADALSAADPSRATTFRDDAAIFIGQLRALDTAYTRGLATCARRLLVTGHEAFGYLAQRYGLEQVGVTGVTPEAEPTPDRLAQISDLVQERGVTTVFAEAQLPPDAIETIAHDTGATVAVLDPLETRAPGQGDYLSRMRTNLDALREGLGCG